MKDIEAMEDIFLKLMFSILKNYMTFTMIYNFYLKEVFVFGKTTENARKHWYIKLITTE